MIARSVSEMGGKLTLAYDDGLSDEPEFPQIELASLSHRFRALGQKENERRAFALFPWLDWFIQDRPTVVA